MLRLWLIAIVALLIVSLTGCGAAQKKRSEGQSCKRDADCADGLKCYSGPAGEPVEDQQAAMGYTMCAASDPGPMP